MSAKTLNRTQTIDRETLRKTIVATLSSYGMTLEEFVDAGISDKLVDDELRDLWLSVSIVAKRLVGA